MPKRKITHNFALFCAKPGYQDQVTWFGVSGGRVVEGVGGRCLLRHSRRLLTLSRLSLEKSRGQVRARVLTCSVAVTALSQRSCRLGRMGLGAAWEGDEGWRKMRSGRRRDGSRSIDA